MKEYVKGIPVIRDPRGVNPCDGSLYCQRHGMIPCETVIERGEMFTIWRNGDMAYAVPEL